MWICASCGSRYTESEEACLGCGTTAFGPAELHETELGTPTAESATPRPPTISVGRLFAGRYQVQGVLGRGGMGQVYRVRDTRDGSPRALKVTAGPATGEARRNDRFRREIAALERIDHPTVPRVHDWGIQGEQLYFVSDLVDGHDLKREIQERGALDATEAARIAAHTAEGLAAAHSLGILHRDVKPQNIMLAGDRSVRLVDFGLARGGGIDVTTLTRTGMIVGTPAYMSPEQFDGLDLDVTSDVYSLGVVIFEALTGKLPFRSATPMGVALMHKGEPPPSPRQLTSSIPSWLERVTLRCLEKEPSLRYPSAGELARELQRGASSKPRWRRLPTGDRVLEQGGVDEAWPLVRASGHERSGWSVGMALQWQGRHYKLANLECDGSGRWIYRFDYWPYGEVFRGLLDYDAECEAAAGGGRLEPRDRPRRR